MTLRARLLFLTFAMVAIVAVSLILVNLDTLAIASLDSAISTSEMANRQIQSVIVRRLATAPPLDGPNSVEAHAAWNEMVATDHDLAALMEQTMAQSRAIVEISVADQNGFILASSNPARKGTPMMRREDLRRLREAGPSRRMASILSASADYETRVPLGIEGQPRPVLTIQTLISTVLLRAATERALVRLAFISGVALVLAFLVAWWAANLALKPLARIGHLIDDIVGGRPLEADRAAAARELAVVEDKLSILGEQYRDARQDLEGALQQLDAGTRRQVEDHITVARRLTAINSLTGRVAHEIKNPLNSIALRLEVLRGHITDGSPDADAEISVLTEEVTRLDRVVRTFLDFNRPVNLSFEDTDVGQMISEIRDFITPEAEMRGVVCTIDAPEEPVVVRADNNLLRQAFLNIAMNAVEAMSNGGELRIEIRPDGSSCEVRFRDTGPGIATANQEKIFQLYYTTKPRGNGIGLAMTFRAIQIHGGTIQVQSEPGNGTEFVVQLPATQERNPATPS